MTELLQTLASYVPGLIARRIAADPTPITRATAERFPAAVLFADISGFTPLTERLAQRGPADAVRAFVALKLDCLVLGDLVASQPASSEQA